jgi:RNA polymerase sigma-70 factor (ECF subfamily)
VFFDAYWRLIYSVALKAGLTQVEAEEVVQETVICVAKNIQKFKRDRRLGSFKGWLCNLTRWRIADQLRKRTRLRQDDGEVERAPELPQDFSVPVDEAAAGEWDQEWRLHLVDTAKRRVKARVSEEQYQLFDLYVLKEWPMSRICDVMGVSAARVYLAKHRIKRLLENEVRRLEKEWDSQ